MLTRATLSELFESPVGRCVAGESYLYFCADPELFGFLLWGRPSGEEITLLRHALEVELKESIQPHRSLVDASRVEMADEAAFEVLQRYVAENRARLSHQVTRLALVRPGGMTGAVIAGFYQVLDPPYPVEIFDRIDNAIAWLDADATLAAELARLHAEVSETPFTVGVLRTVLAKQLQKATIESAARAMGLSKRTLQRRLGEVGTSFQDELSLVRIREAQRLLLTTNAPITSVALDVGVGSVNHFSTLFKKLCGEPPSEWRARRKS